MTAITSATNRFARILAHLGGAVLCAVMLLLVSGAVLRVFSVPLPITYEAVSTGALATGALALGEAQVHKAHVAVDIATGRLGRSARLAIGAVVTLASIALFAQVALGLLGYGFAKYATGSATEVLRTPHWPLVAVLLLGAVGLLAALLGDLARLGRARRSPSAETDLW